MSQHYATPAGPVRAVDGLTLDVAGGRSVAITGPSGCGKSTLLGLIGGLETPTAGRVEVGGRELSAAVRAASGARLRRQAARLRVPVRQPAAVPDRARERRAAARAGAAARTAYEPLPASCSTTSASAARPTSSRTSSRAASASGWRGPRAGPPARLILADEPTGSLDADNAAADRRPPARRPAGGGRDAGRRHPRPGGGRAGLGRTRAAPAPTAAAAEPEPWVLATSGATWCATRAARSRRWSGSTLGVGLFSARAVLRRRLGRDDDPAGVAPLALDMQRVLTAPLGRGLRFEERVAAPARCGGRGGDGRR